MAMPVEQSSDVPLRDYVMLPSGEKIAISRVMLPAGKWRQLLQDLPDSIRRLLRQLYGDDEAVIAERLKLLRQVLDLFIRWRGPDREVVITRAPGRVNLMGRHVDHRGGYVNTMTLQREIVAVASPRPDGRVHIINISPQFEADEFDVREELPFIRACDNWLEYLSSERMQNFHTPSMGRWGNYVRAGIFRLAMHFPDHPFIGMDVAVGGDLPMGAGLSSSSALLVATSFAAVVINGFDLRPRTFVDLAGEGEWFVGTRGGAADHAAMTLGDRGRVTPIRFFPFVVEEPVPFPEGCELLICNSRVQAKKSEGAKDLFNHRVASYEIATALFCKFFPEHAARVEHLRDINPENLGISLAELYRMIARLPEQASRPLVRQLLQDRSEWLERVFSTHADTEPYRIRAVLLYGISECRRSAMFQHLLREGRVETIGAMMKVSHEGDRVVHFGSGGPHLYEYRASQEMLLRLAHEAEQGFSRAALEWQPGWYGSSCWEIDKMVDIVCAVPGVLGAQMSGAGMGGCMMALVRSEAAEAARAALVREYYEPAGLEPEVYVCRPIAGASPLWVPE